MIALLIRFLGLFFRFLNGAWNTLLNFGRGFGRVALLYAVGLIGLALLAVLPPIPFLIWGVVSNHNWMIGISCLWLTVLSGIWFLAAVPGVLLIAFSRDLYATLISWARGGRV